MIKKGVQKFDVRAVLTLAVFSIPVDLTYIMIYHSIDDENSFFHNDW